MHMLFFLVIEISMIRGSRSACKSGNILYFCLGMIYTTAPFSLARNISCRRCSFGWFFDVVGFKAQEHIAHPSPNHKLLQSYSRNSKGSIWKRNAALSMTQTAFLRPLILLLFFLLDGETNVSELQPPGNARSKSQQPLCFSPSPANAFRSQNGK